jgi:hypothetical protein
VIILPRYGTDIVLICVAGKDADTILNDASFLSILIPFGHFGITTNLLARVPPLKPSLKLIIEFFDAIIVLELY